MISDWQRGIVLEVKPKVSLDILTSILDFLEEKRGQRIGGERQIKTSSSKNGRETGKNGDDTGGSRVSSLL